MPNAWCTFSSKSRYSERQNPEINFRFAGRRLKGWHGHCDLILRRNSLQLCCPTKETKWANHFLSSGEVGLFNPRPCFKMPNATLGSGSLSESSHWHLIFTANCYDDIYHENISVWIGLVTRYCRHPLLGAPLIFCWFPVRLTCHYVSNIMLGTWASADERLRIQK